MNLVATIMAGGASSRMGTDKAELRLGEETLLERTVRIASGCGVAVYVIGRDRPTAWSGPACAFVRDLAPGEGPLGGIVSALAAADGAAVLALPCDLPALTPAAVTWLVERWRRHGRAHGTVAQREDRVEPLFAVYAPAALDPLRAALGRGERSCWRAIRAGDYDLADVPAEHTSALRDCDTPEDWRSASS